MAHLQKKSMDRGRKGERSFPGVGPQSLATLYPRRSLP
jgi:hypothetical protein